MNANKPAERWTAWHLNWLPVETMAERSLKLTGVGKEVTFPSRFNRLCSFSPHELLSLYLSLFPLCLKKNPLHTSPESTWAFRKWHIYIHTRRDTRDTHTPTPAELIAVLQLHLPPSAVERVWLLMAGNGFDPTPSGFLLKNIRLYSVTNQDFYVLCFFLPLTKVE